MNNVSLKQLRYFEALARQKHFGKAAEQCSVTQPALSVQIKELETELGLRLVERNARRVRLTRNGEQMLTRTRDILRAVDELSDFARAASDRLVGRLRIGVIPTIAPYLLPRVIGVLNHVYGELDIQIRETLTPQILPLLADGKLDLALLALPISEPQFTEFPLFDEEFVLVRPASDAGLPTPDRSKLHEMKLLLLEEGHCFRDQALSFCSTRPALAKDGLDASSLSTLVQMVSAGIGVTLVPEMALPVETRSANVCLKRFSRPAPTRTVGLIWRTSNPLSEKLLGLANILENSISQSSQIHSEFEYNL